MIFKIYKHISNLIKLNSKLIKNPTITDNLSRGYKNLSFDILDLITDDGPNYYDRIQLGPLNNQSLRTKLVDELLINFKPDLIIETGTFLGDSTEFFGNYSKVLSVEKSKLYYLLSKSRFINNNVIEIKWGDSKDVLRNIKLFDNKIFFYLDAHWGQEMPLKDEIDFIISNFKNYIICIDDFAVPNDSSWGYDIYDDVKLDINLINLNKELYIFFPSYNASKESGEKRGTVFLTNKDSHNKIFEHHNFEINIL